jgi:hypothetical protein
MLEILSAYLLIGYFISLYDLGQSTDQLINEPVHIVIIAMVVLMLCWPMWVIEMFNKG